MFKRRHQKEFNKEICMGGQGYGMVKHPQISKNRGVSASV